MSSKRRIPLKSISLIAFDLNRTLVKRGEAFERSFIESVSEMLGRWETEDRERLPDVLLHKYKEERESFFRGKNAAAAEESELQRGWLKQAVAGLPLPADDRFLTALQARISELQTHYASWNEGAEEALMWAKEAAQVAIITDMPRRRALAIWSRLGMNRYVKETMVFSPNRGSAAHPADKSSGKLYADVCRALSLRPERCVMVGDSYLRDVAGARKAGWRAVWLKPSRESRRLPSRARLVPTVRTLKHLPSRFQP